MSNGQIDFQDALALVELIKASSNFSEIRLRSGDVEIELRRNGGAAFDAASASRAAPSSAAPSGSMQAPSESTAAAAAPMPTAKSAPPTPAASEAARTAPRQGATVIKSPMVGTVYHAPEPGAAPFVRVGQTVSPGDQICIVEVMKLMNSIHAESHGVIAEILVADGEAVEYGQELFVISTH